MDYEERRKPQETGFPITIGEDCWIGAGVTICPGVTIGDRTVIAAGSVVTKDIPSDVLAAGVPAVVKKRLNV
jgi:maltose O-acetyltransferase